MSDDPLAILGLKAPVKRSEIESAFRRQALKCHPDKHKGDPLAKARFVRLLRAKEAALNSQTQRAAGTSQASGKKAQRPQPATGTSSGAKRDSTSKTSRVNAAKRAAYEAELKRRAAAERAAAENERARREQERRKRRAQQAREAEEAAQAQQKQQIFENHLKKRAPPRVEPDDSSEPPLSALMRRFKASKESKLLLAGPFGAGELRDLMALAASMGLEATPQGAGLCLRPEDGDESPWEPPEGTQAHKREKQAKLRKRRKARKQDNPQDRALERLKKRREEEAAAGSTVQSWWFHDEEAERYSQYVDRCGF